MLKDMAKTDGAEELENGVVLHVLEYGPEGKGQGKRPSSNSVCLMHYHGTLADGSVFDTSIGGNPIQLPLNQVIPGMKDGVMKMHEGEAAMLGIPPEHAYGEKGTPDGSIPGGKYARMSRLLDVANLVSLTILFLLFSLRCHVVL